MKVCILLALVACCAAFNVPMDINSVASKIADKINTVIKNQEVKVPAHLLEAIQSMIDDRAAMEELVQNQWEVFSPHAESDEPQDRCFLFGLIALAALANALNALTTAATTAAPAPGR